MDAAVGISKAPDPYPSATRRGTVLMLPGRAYDCEMPLLAWTTRALQARGWTVFHARWVLPTVPERPRDFVERVVRQFEALDREPGRRPPSTAPALLTSLDAINTAVKQAREEQDASHADVWLPDPARPGDGRELTDRECRICEDVSGRR